MHTSARRPLAVATTVTLAMVITLVAGIGAASSAPVQDATTAQETIAKMARVSVGANHACGISDTRALYCWGSNDDGQLGTDLVVGVRESYVPVAVATTGTPLAGKDIEEVETGHFATCARATDDTLACWGLNDRGQLGNGTTTDADLPTAVTVAGTPLDGADIVDIDMSYKHVCALTAAGAISCWGLGSVGQLGTGTYGSLTVPTAVVTVGTPLDGHAVAQVAAGAFTTCAVTTGGGLACWGAAFRGGLGNGQDTARTNTPISPTTVGTPLDGKIVDQVTVGRYGGCASTTTSELACWGAGETGQIGNGADANVLVPTAVSVVGTPLAGATVTTMDSGFDHHCALTSAGSAACWGSGNKLGSEASGNANTPRGVTGAGTILDGVKLDELRTNDGGGCANGPGRQPGCWGVGAIRGAGSADYSATATPIALRYEAPGDAPAFTSISADGRRVDLEWGDVVDNGGAEISEVTIGIYVNGVLVDTKVLTGRGNGGSNAGYSLDYDTTYQFTLAAANGAGYGPTSGLSAPVTTGSLPAAESTYTAITPCRVVDTRQGGGPFANREIRDYTVTGSGGVFALQGGKADGCGIPGGVEAVEASVTAVGPATSGFFRAWPTGQSMPNATFMNFDQGMDITNTGAITINSQPVADNVANGGGGGEVRARNFGGASHYVIDIQGYYGDVRSDPNVATAAESVASQYVPITPCRIVDTRQAGGTLGNREIRDVAVTGDGPAFAAQGGTDGGCGLPEGSVAVEASVTAVGPATSGFFRAWPTGQSMPNATFMNFDQGMDITNTGAITIANTHTAGVDEQLRIRNFGGASHYVIDIQGYFIDEDGSEDGAATNMQRGTRYVAMTPCRIVDTRQAGGTLVNREIRNLQVGGDGSAFAAQGGKDDGCGIPEFASAVEASVTAVGPATSGFFRAWPFGESLPNATFMNFDQGMDITNTGSLTLGGEIDGSGALTNATMEQLRIRNYGGTSHYVIDIQGYFVAER